MEYHSLYELYKDKSASYVFASFIYFLTYKFSIVGIFSPWILYLSLLYFLLFLSSLNVLFRVRNKKKSFPRFIYFSNILAFFNFWYYLLFLIHNSIVVFWFSIHKIHPAFMFSLLFAVNYVILVRFPQILKNFTNNDFIIFSFKRFSNNNSDVYRFIIEPVIGCYGNIISLSDYENRLTLYQKFSSFIIRDAMGSYYFQIKASDEEWKEKVITYLNVSDLAVFHWPEFPTENCMWELQQTINFIKSQQILIVISNESEILVKNWLNQNYPNEKFHFYIYSENEIKRKSTREFRLFFFKLMIEYRRNK
jgi:hypothetical protein